jgi:hypothetical protein
VLSLLQAITIYDINDYVMKSAQRLRRFAGPPLLPLALVHVLMFAASLAAASVALAVSALCSWVLSVPEVNSSVPTLRLMHFLSFLAGGVAFAVGFGLLTAGVSVTSFFARLLPRWLIWFGLLIALAGELSSISLVAYPITFTLPLTRFGGFLWLIAVAAILPKTVDAPTEKTTHGSDHEA